MYTYNLVKQLFRVALGLIVVVSIFSILPSFFNQAEGANAAPRPVTPRGDLSEEEKATIQLFEKSKDSVVFITTKAQVQDFWSRNIFSVPRGTGSGFIWDEAGP